MGTGRDRHFGVDDGGLRRDDLPPPAPGTRRRELAMFLMLAVFIWPVLSVAVVGGYGFAVWMSQLIMGPPGPPPV
ncbi:periplasmic nitrate reductase, NapE protein [Azospirillum picis]|uniref:Nitrate reductase NapE n=1 Tax=Azospirillum picis TaxID=488438 RepID=A0ABU0MQL5_9PROT|nr:periplasmic nitrate reductase, NapE protein [Azospirillum picis]MBP2302188.1 nitrate reductase NapE [Azospirillum picis]MDQ0535767.1 nitrate reductase NapE [Azospirillum picis]